MNQAQRPFFLYILLIASTFLSAQHFVADVQHYGTEHGLSHRESNIVYQASNGFIWVGTNYGLNRFDGRSFKVFTKKKHGLSSNQVGVIREDKAGWLWVIPPPPAYTDQISFLNIHTYEVKNMQERFGADCPLLGQRISDIVMGPDKKIYLSIQNRIYQIDDQQISIIYESKESEVRVTSITPNHKILGIEAEYSAQVTFIELDTLGRRTWAYQMPLDPNTQYHKDFFEDSQGIKWIAMESILLYLPPEEKKPQPFSFAALPQRPIKPHIGNSSFYPSPYTTHYWYTGYTQLFVFSLDGSEFFDVGALYPQIIKDRIENIDFDDQNNIWISTPFGLYLVRFKQSAFHNYLNLRLQDYKINEAFSTRGIIVQDSKLLASSTYIKRYTIELASGEISPLPLKKPQDIRNTFVPLQIAAQGGYYAGGNTLLTYAQGENVLETYHWKKNTNPQVIWSIHQDKQQKVWLGLLNHGLGILENDSLHLFSGYNEHLSLMSSSVYHFLPWDDTHTLISSTSGIYVLHATDGIIQRFSTEGDKETYIPADLINHIHRDPDQSDILWVATGGEGLLKLQLRTNTQATSQKTKDFKVLAYEQFTITEGLSHNTLYAIYADSHQNLWISSDYGINRFNKETRLVNIYTTNDGLPFDEFNRISHFQDENGQIFFGSMNGIASFSPENLLGIQDDNDDVPLVITNYQQFDGNTNKLTDRTLELVQDRKIALHPNDKFFTLEFTLLEYADPTLIKYSYKIEGQGDEWINLNDNRLRISGLPYGHFNLHIRARGASGQFATNQLAIPIDVLRPFYLQQWFILLMILLLVLLIGLLFRNRTQVLKKRQVELEETVAARTAKIEQQAEELRQMDIIKSRFYANISHELRTPLTLILAPIEDALKQEQLSSNLTKNLRLAQRNSWHLQKKVNEILDLTKLEAGKLILNTETVNWNQFLSVYVGNFEYLAATKAITFTVRIETDDALQVELDVHKMEMLLGNILSNAFKFTPGGGRITLIAKQEDQQLSIHVKDTGPGIAHADLDHIFDRFYQSTHKGGHIAGGTGIGLSIVRELASLMEGNVTVDSQLGLGSTFNVYIPKKVASQSSDIQDAPSGNYIPLSQELLPIVETTPSSQQKPTILLVEDHLDLQVFIKDILSTNYYVITAFNGKEALTYLSDMTTKPNQVDLVLSDLMMPVMDGYQLLEVLKSNYPTIPVIVLTARGALQAKLKALRIGVDDYLTKPFSQVELQLRIKNLLKNAQNRRQAIAEENLPIPEDNTVLKTFNTEIPKDTELRAWLIVLEEKVVENYSNFDYTAERLAGDLHISKRQLLRRMRVAVGLTPGQYLKMVRLTKARELLANGTSKSVKATALAVGYKDATYFSKMFQKEFGKLPSAFLRN